MWGGKSSPVQDIENTGSIFVFAVGRDRSDIQSVAWVASSVEEEELIENWLGCEVEPGRFHMRNYIPPSEEELVLPENWYENFPTGKDIFNFVVQQLPSKTWTNSIDTLLLKRRELEFEVFGKIEERNVTTKDLTFMFDSEENLTKVFNNQISLTLEQIEKLAQFFQISPAVFLQERSNLDS